MKKANALVEQRNRDVQATARVLLDTAGLPTCFWPFAAPYGTLMRNVRPSSLDAGLSPYQKTHGEEFPATLYHVGCKVNFTPNTAQGASFHKFDTHGPSGVFAGYSMKDGYRWDGHYLVWDLRDFAGMDLGMDDDPARYQHMTPYKVKEVFWPKEGVVFHYGPSTRG